MVSIVRRSSVHCAVDGDDASAGDRARVARQLAEVGRHDDGRAVRRDTTKRPAQLIRI